LSFGTAWAFACGDGDALAPAGSSWPEGLAGAVSAGAGAPASAGAPGNAGTSSPGLGAGGGPTAAGASGELLGFPWDEDSPGRVPSSDVSGQAALALIQRSCGQCHGDDAPTDIAGPLDLAGLVDRGWIVPGSSATSPVVAVIVEGHVPVTGFYDVRATIGEIEVLTRFIDRLPLQAPDCAPLSLVSPDAARGAMASDISRLAPEARPFARYVGLTHVSNAGLCGAALDLQRQALGQVFNATSTREPIVLPAPIDELQLIYRIDLRDYGWDRGIDLEGDGVVDFADGWQAAVAAAGVYAEEYRGPNAEALASATGTAVPFLPSNALVHAVADGELYSALIGVGSDVALHRSELGIPGQVESLSLLEGDEPVPASLWAGFGRRREAIVVRSSQDRLDRSYWLIHEGTWDAESVFDSPFELDHGPDNMARFQILFALPNGMLGYAIEANDSSRRGSDLLHGQECCGSARVGLASCSACHADGVRLVRDEVRDFLLANGPLYLATSELDAVRELYLPQRELEASIEADNISPRAALQKLGIAPGARDPLSSVYSQFELGLTARRAAGELGVGLETLQAAIATPGRLPTELAPLRTGSTVERAVFTAVLPAALCELQQGSANRPARCF
jgi:mono/diheme cytochrome c family protein